MNRRPPADLQRIHPAVAYRPGEVATLVGVTFAAVRRAIVAGELPATTVDRVLRVRGSDLLA